MTVHAGIDEAGYGPTLGPLVVASSAFRIEAGVRDSVLHRLISLGARAGGLAIGDSKQLYRGKDGLARLETSLLGHAVLGRGLLPLRADVLLTGALDCPAAEILDQPWYGARLLSTPLPRRALVDEVLTRAARQGELLADRGLSFLDFAVAPVLEPRFNRLTLARGTKAWPLFLATGRLIDALMARHPEEELVIHVDRHGGRAHYKDLLSEFFPLAPIRTLSEGASSSSYRMEFPHRPPVRLTFQVKADGHFATVALASVVAKTVRELFMESFNTWFGAAAPGVLPTAGYPQDAKRFLQDIAPLLDVSVPRARLIRVR